MRTRWWMISPLGVVLLGLVLLRPEPAGNPDAFHIYWPRFPRPKTVLIARPCPSVQMAVVQQTLSGLVSHAAREGRCSEAVWVAEGHPTYARWLAMMLQQTGARRQGPFDTWTLVDRYAKRGIVKGYILFQPDASMRGVHAPGPMDASVNVATCLCAFLGGIAVSPDLEAEAKAHGLRRLLDARTMTEDQCFNRYRAAFSRRALSELDPKSAMTRAETVALGAFAVSRPGPLYEKALSRLDPDSPVLGWMAGDEGEITAASSRWGHFQTSTDWCSNLALMSTEPPETMIRQAKRQRPAGTTLWDLRWEDSVHYVSFLMSDGDNVQWQMGNFQGGDEDSWWANHSRGNFPMGWSGCYVDLAQVCPYALEHLYRTATTNDDFVLMSGGYYYPDLFGTSRTGEDPLRRHAARIGQYMDAGGIRLICANAQKVASPGALRAYGTYAREIPNLLGVMMYQYAPYTAGQGRVFWVKDRRGDDLPVVTCRYAIWGRSPYPQDGPPGKVAKMLNAIPHKGPPTDASRFSWVMVHAWSWFRQPSPGRGPESEEVDPSTGRRPGIERGLSPVKWCVQALQPHVRVVTPTGLVLQMRLRLRPRQTLARALDDLAVECNRCPDANIRRLARDRVGKARVRLMQSDYRKAFEYGQQAHRLLARRR